WPSAKLVALTPAQAAAPSRPPRCSTAAATAPASASPSVMSATASKSAPAAGERSMPAVRHPAARSQPTTARPSPEAAPVTRAAGPTSAITMTNIVKIRPLGELIDASAARHRYLEMRPGCAENQLEAPPPHPGGAGVGGAPA